MFFLFFQENKICYFKQIILCGENLHEMTNLIFLEK